MGYIIAFVIGGIFGLLSMCLVAVSGKHNDYEAAYEQGKHDALREVSQNNI